MKSKKEEVLRQLKVVRKAKNISYQDIVDGTEEMGVAVSLSSVKRVFAEDSQASDFRYDSTIRPIVRFVMGIDSGLDDLETYEEAKANAEGLAAVVDYKDALIKRLESELERAREEHRETIQKMEAAEERKIAYLREEIQRIREEKKTSEIQMERWRTRTVLFIGLFVASLLLVIAYLLADHGNQSWGIFWTENPAPLAFVAILFGGGIVSSLIIAYKKR